MHRRRRVLIINTGGTMGMRPTAKGLAPSAGYLSERIRCMEELASDALPLVEVLDFDPLLDSSDFEPSDWVAIARCIETHYLTFDGFVVVMGTDTLAYCASALSFMLENLAKVCARRRGSARAWRAHATILTRALARRSTRARARLPSTAGDPHR